MEENWRDFIFWGVFLFSGLIMAAYLVWMRLVERD